MREIIPNSLWLGNRQDVRDVPSLMARSLTVVVDLAMEEAAAQLPHDIAYCRFPLVDGDGNPPAMIQAALRTIVTFIETKTPMLIACSGGMSRAPALVAMALAQTEGIEPTDALARIAQTGPHDVSTALWNQLMAVTGRHH